MVDFVTSVPSAPAEVTRTFNSFAEQASADFPHLRTSLVVFRAVPFSYSSHVDYAHRTVGDYFGPVLTTSPDTSYEQKLGMARQIQEGLLNPVPDYMQDSPGKTTFADMNRRQRVDIGGHQQDIVAIRVWQAGQGHSTTPTGGTAAEELRRVLEHELGHVVAAGGDGALGRRLGENAADTFSVLRTAQQGGNHRDHLDAALWDRSVGFVHRIQGSSWQDDADLGRHLTSFSLMGLHDLNSRNPGLARLSPVEAANLSARVAREFSPDDKTVRKLADVYAPVSKLLDVLPYGQNDSSYSAATLKKALEKTAEITFGPEGQKDPHVRALGLALLKPAVEGRADILQMHLRPGEVFDSQGAAWDKIRESYRQASFLPPPRARLQGFLPQEQQDQKLLGAYDRRPAGRLIGTAELDHVAARAQTSAAAEAIAQAKLAAKPVKLSKAFLLTTAAQLVVTAGLSLAGLAAQAAPVEGAASPATTDRAEKRPDQAKAQPR